MQLQIQMLGGFSIRNGSKEVMQIGGRSRKNWSLLAYLIYYRNRSISTDKLMDLLWGEDDKSSDPLNALKVTLHRMRANLNKLADDAGHLLIIHQEGSYSWNNEVPVTIDADEFERLCREGMEATDNDTKIEHWEKALALYKGDFLTTLASESWVIPASAYYHNMYIQVAQNILKLLETRGLHQKIISISRSAISLEPYQEEFYAYLMRALCKIGDYNAAVSTYEEMRSMFFSNFGVMPSEETQEVYRKALSDISDRSSIPPGTIMEQLREPEAAGAFICDYDVFKHIYRSQARTIIRSGDIAHIALFSLTPKESENLAKRSLDTAIENLEGLLKKSLRRGDVISRCSVSQFIVLLNQANYENSLSLCTRLIRAFNKQYPHSPVQITAAVHPIEPN